MNTNLGNRVGSVNPLLMNFTPPTKIEEETNCHKVVYDEINQITGYNMRIIGTRCLKTESTRKKNQGFISSIFFGDEKKKNAIDDSKSVK